ncbi:hypothetical protein FBQ97_21000 [Acidobacteria bacterium ACD]|nr:hypothetical protein [Acidobacteria bacterium ACD]
MATSRGRPVSRGSSAPSEAVPRLSGSAEAAPQERDACGVGFFARASGEPGNDILLSALEALTRLTHRGAASGDNSGDGAGLLLQVPRRLILREARRLGLPVSVLVVLVGTPLIALFWPVR